MSIVSDGWTDPQRRPLIYFMNVRNNVPIFLKVKICEGEYKDKFSITQEVIMEVIKLSCGL